MIKAIVFDLDDTLIKERDYVFSGYKAVSVLLAPKCAVSAEAVCEKMKELFFESPKNVFNRVFDFYGVAYTKSDVMSLVEAYRNHMPEISFFTDVEPFSAELKEKGFKTAILSDGFAAAQRKKIEALHAESFFDEIVLTGEWGDDFGKPSLKGFQLLADRFSIQLSEMLYVGDNPAKDFLVSEGGIVTARIYRPDAVYAQGEYAGGVRENCKILSLFDLRKYIY